MKVIAIQFCSVLLLILGGFFDLQGQTEEEIDRKEIDSLVAYVPRVENFRIEEGIIHFSVGPPDLIAPGEDSASWQQKNYSISFGNVVSAMDEGLNLPAELSPTKDSLHFQMPLPHGIFPGEHFFAISCDEEPIWLMHFKVKSPNSIAGHQPFIEEISPRGTRPGRTVTVTGKNLGNDLNDIYIWFTGVNGEDLPASLSEVINPAFPTYLTSPNPDGFQILKFSVPGENSWGASLDDFQDADFFEHELRMKVVVRGQPSANSPVISVIRENTGLKILGILAIIIALAMLTIWLIARQINKRSMKAVITWKTLVVDPISNHYSLTRIQALA